MFEIMRECKKALGNDVAKKVKEDRLRMFDNLTNHGMLDLMEHQFDRYNKLNFGGYFYTWQKWIRR